MSLAALPDELMAHIASYLPYSEVCNLIETSKKNHSAIRRFGKDKLKVNVICFRNPENRRHQREKPVFEGKDISETTAYWGTDIITHRYSFKYYAEDVPLVENLQRVLNECSSIGTIQFENYNVTADALQIIGKTNTKIGKFEVDNGGDTPFTPDEFVSFCQKFPGTKFIDTAFNTGIWTDEVLVMVIEASTEICLSDIAEEYVGSVSTLTDRTLKALRGDYFLNTNIFQIYNIHNSFTVKEIANLAEFILDGYHERVEYHLGVLQSNQCDEAICYFDENSGVLRDNYQITTSENGVCKSYWIGIILNDDYERYYDPTKQCSTIEFDVIIPKSS